MAERMVKAALWCVQCKPESGPPMSVVVKMLEGSMEIPKPLYLYQYLTDGNRSLHPFQETQSYATLESGFTVMVTGSSILCATPIVRKYEIEIVVIAVKIMIVVVVCRKLTEKKKCNSVVPASRFQAYSNTMDKFLENMEREKPIRFTAQQLSIATDNFTSLLGSGGFGQVYKGIFKGTIIAVKVLHGNSDKSIEQQFMAEVSTIGTIHHINLVRLYGFCLERHLRALVYEYMGNGSLDRHLFYEKNILAFEKLHEIAIGTAQGIAYLHEGCQQRIIHYDIKPGNILLDKNFCPKVSDFGLAKHCTRENTHITMTGGRGTPGYAAPEVWLPFPVTHKCDVYSFGMLLFEILCRRRNHDVNLSESQEWLPMWVWKKLTFGQLGDLNVVYGIEEKNKEMAERMVKVALWCVQYRPESRPLMSVVVKMLEGSMEIPNPLNPFEYLTGGIHPLHLVQERPTFSTDESGSIVKVTGS